MGRVYRGLPSRWARTAAKIACLGLPGVATLLSTTPAHAAEAISLPPLGAAEMTILYVVLASAFVALGYGYLLVRQVMAKDAGTPEMQAVAGAIHDGAMAYLKRQVHTMKWLVLVLFVGLWFMYKGIPEYQGGLAIGVSFAFLLGVAASYGAGYVGMKMAVRRRFPCVSSRYPLQSVGRLFTSLPRLLTLQPSCTTGDM